MLPARADILAVRFLQQTDRAVAQRYLSPARDLIQLDLHMVECGIRHEHGTAQFQQYGRLDDLHVAPEMADAVAPVTKPAAARPLLQNHVHGFAGWIGAALAETVQDRLKDV